MMSSNHIKSLVVARSPDNTSPTAAPSTAGSDCGSISNSNSENDDCSEEDGDDFTFKPRQVKKVNFADRRLSVDSGAGSRASVLSYDEEELKDDIAPLGQR